MTAALAVPRSRLEHLNRKLLREKFDRLAEVGERDFDRVALRRRAGFRVIGDETAFLGGSQDGGGLHDGSPGR